MLVGLVLVDKIYLDLKCLLYKMASNVLQPGVFIIENNSSCSIEKELRKKRKKKKEKKEKIIW